MTTISSLAHLSDEQLLAEVKARACNERCATAALIASLAELDARRLYLRASHSSLFTYCTHVLHLSEHAAYGRIEAQTSPSPPPKRPAVVAPLAPECYKVQFTVSAATYDKLRRAQDLMRRATRPTAMSSRHIPASVKREVWQRDGGRCAFVGTNGRCGERGFLEFHHVVPYADGGEAVAANIELRCRAHNAYEAEQWFGPLYVREDRGCYSPPTRSGPSWEC